MIIYMMSWHIADRQPCYYRCPYTPAVAGQSPTHASCAVTLVLIQVGGFIAEAKRRISLTVSPFISYQHLPQGSDWCCRFSRFSALLV